MKQSIHFFPARRHASKALVVALCIAPHLAATGLVEADYSKALAFTRFVASQRQPGPFDRSDSVGILIEASLPGLYKSAAVLAIRGRDDNRTETVRILQAQGDGTVGEEVIGHYLALQQQLEDLPPTSTAVTPANYKFRFSRAVSTGGGTAYVYDITPKKSRPGLVSGQLWMDAATGRELMLAGTVAQMRDKERVAVVRDTKVVEGSALGRVTHVAFTVSGLGRAEIVITEVILNARTLGLGD